MCVRWKISIDRQGNIPPPPLTLPTYKKGWPMSLHLTHLRSEICNEPEHTITPSIYSFALLVKRWVGFPQS